jgi:hypothetical protein
MATLDLGPKARGFEVLLYTFFDGWTSFAYDENDDSVTFSTVQEALRDLQSAFDIWEAQIKDGERGIGDSYLPSDFAIRSTATNERCGLALDGGQIRLQSSAEFAKINATGQFG